MSNERSETGCEPMAKQQRSVQLSPGIYTLCELYEAGHGVRFNRQVTAGLLAFAFSDLVAVDDEDAAAYFPQRSFWLQLAVQIERGKLDILDVPLALLDSMIDGSERRLRLRRRKDAIGTIDPKCIERSLEIYRERKRGWENDLKDFGGKLEAIRDHLKPFSA